MLKNCYNWLMAHGSWLMGIVYNFIISIIASIIIPQNFFAKLKFGV